jgi:glutamyl-tRNA reductase
MSKIVVKPELYKRVEEAAREQKASVDEIFAQAIRRYLWELDRRKISEESKAYREQHVELKTQHLGEYIAMHEGQVVDHDKDFSALRRRVRQRFGHTPVMITQVEEIAERPLVRRGFSMEAANL